MSLIYVIASISVFVVPFSAYMMGGGISDLNAEVMEMPSPVPELEKDNKRLSDTELLFKDEVLGPESLAISPIDGLMYTGLMDGRIIRFNPKQKSPTFEEFARFNLTETCAPFVPKERGGGYDLYDPAMEPICGRPLGMRFDEQGRLVVAQSYKGIYRFSGFSGISGSGEPKRELLAESVTENDKAEKNNVNDKRQRKFTLVNDVAISADTGMIYFTESSDRWGRNKIVYELVAGRKCGKLLRVNPEAPFKVEIVAENLPLANGVTYYEGNIYFIAGPTIWKFNEASGQVTKHLDNLPIIGDNIRARHDKPGHFLVGAASKRSKPFSLLDSLANFPRVRNYLAAIFSPATLLKLVPRMGVIIEVDLTSANPNLVATYQDRSEKGIAYISEAEIVDEYVYIGSWHESYLARLTKEQMFEGRKKKGWFARWFGF